MTILCTSSRFLAAAITLIACTLTTTVVTTTEAYTTSSDLRQLSRGGLQHGPRKQWNMPSSPSSAGGGSQPKKSSTDGVNSAQKMLQRSSGSDPERRRGAGWKLSQAAINTDAGSFAPRASSPSRTAHGILSPETVTRMDEITMGGRGNEAVRLFLQAYRQRGPMSCLEMLSDPNVLPHLTKAMRDTVV